MKVVLMIPFKLFSRIMFIVRNVIVGIDVTGSLSRML